MECESGYHPSCAKPPCIARCKTICEQPRSWNGCLPTKIGRWDSNGCSCQEDDCGPAIPTPPTHAGWAKEGQSGYNPPCLYGAQGNFLPKAHCAAVCNPGYEGTGTAEYTCGTGHWRGGNLVCRGSCSGPPTAHSVPCTGSFGANCTATCEPAYQNKGGSDQYICGADGKWTGGTLVCDFPCCHDPTNPTRSLCRHTGRCVDDAPQRSHCECSGRWWGRVCENSCSDDDCRHGGMCIGVLPAETQYTCNCSVGYRGEHCAEQDLCLTTHPCHGGTCRVNNTNMRGYSCDCLPGYEGVDCQPVGPETSWDVVCIAATFMSLLFTPYLVRRYKRSLLKLGDPHLPEGNDAVGIFGGASFLYGLVDLIVDVSLCFTLSSCGQTTLLWCCGITLANTVAITWYLGYTTLRQIVAADNRHGSPTRTWLGQYTSLGPLIVLASSSNLSSMAILRFRLCGTMLVDFPDHDDHRYFHFLRNAGLYHYITEDIPHILISVALLYAANQEGFEACEISGRTKMVNLPDAMGGGFVLPVSDRDIAWASLVCSLGSISFGAAGSALQLLTLVMVEQPVAVELSSDVVTDSGRLPENADLNPLRESVANAIARLQSAGVTFFNSGENNDEPINEALASNIGGSE